MSNVTYQFSIPLLLRGFDILSSYIALARQHIEAHGLDESDILTARLAPDMLPFAGQIQRASDKAKNGIARLAEVKPPAFTDTEQSLSELDARIARTVEFLSSVDAAKLDGADERSVELRFRSVSGVMSGHTYLTQVLMPDFYFHIAIAHGILRSKGLAVGKANFIGQPDYLAG